MGGMYQQLSGLLQAPPGWFTHAVLSVNQVIFSLMHTLAHPALEVFPPVAFAALRLSVGLPFIALLARKERDFFASLNWRRDILWIIPLGLVMVTIPQYFTFLGNHLAGAGMATAFAPSVPVNTYALGVLLGQESLTWRSSLGILLAVIATLSLLRVETLSFTSDKSGGMLILVLQNVSYAGALVWMKVLLRVRGSPVGMYLLAASAGWVALILAALPPLTRTHWTQLTLEVWIAVLFAGLFASCFGHVMNTWAVHHCSPTVPALYGCMQPVVGVALAVTFLGEHFGLRDGVSIGCIILGLVLVTYGRLESTKPLQYTPLGETVAKTCIVTELEAIVDSFPEAEEHSFSDMIDEWMDD